MLDVLRGIDPIGLDYDAWIQVGYGVKAALGEHGEGVWLAWSRASARHDGTSGPKGTPERMWRGIKPQRCGWRYLERLAGRSPVDNPDLHDAFDEAFEPRRRRPARGRAAAPTVAENIKPIVWPEMLGRYAPPRRFVAKGWIPYGCVTSLYGQGGIGKSMAAQLLGTAVVTGRYWLGIETERCRVLALFCEDDRNELWRRQERINATLGVTMADLGDFLPDARTGQENVLAHGRDVLQTTELYDQIAAAIAELKPGLVILDNIAQMFAGNENDRAHVTQLCAAHRLSPARSTCDGRRVAARSRPGRRHRAPD